MGDFIGVSGLDFGTDVVGTGQQFIESIIFFDISAVSGSSILGKICKVLVEGFRYI